MGLYDYIRMDGSIELPEGIPDDYRLWQTKEFDCRLRTYHITDGGRLVEENQWKADFETTSRPLIGDWTDKDYRGEIYAITDVQYDETHRIVLEFTNGELEEIRERDDA